jgi:hypothetical protein
LALPGVNIGGGNFQGRCWRLAVELGAQRIRLDWPEAPPVGSSHAFSLPPERCIVLDAW